MRLSRRLFRTRWRRWSAATNSGALWLPSARIEVSMTDPTSDAPSDPSTDAGDAATSFLPPRPLLASVAGRGARVWRALQRFEVGRFALFLVLAFIGFLYGLSLLGGSSGTTTYLEGSVNLYTNGTAADSAILDIKMDPVGVYSLISIRPASRARAAPISGRSITARRPHQSWRLHSQPRSAPAW
jgi:hypothetical protein